MLVSPAFPGDLPPSDVPATIELTDRMTAYTRPINWLGWPSAVTIDGAMHTGLDEAAVLAHALAWEAGGGTHDEEWRRPPGRALGDRRHVPLSHPNLTRTARSGSDPSSAGLTPDVRA